MSIEEIKVPVLGESITEVSIEEWVKANGDRVEVDEIICVLGSDKASFELRAENAGQLEILVEEGETVPIDTVLCKIDTSKAGGTVSETPKVEDKVEKASGTKTGEVKQMVVSNLGESITEVTIGSWLKADGDFVNEDETLCEIESDKATFELPAEASGYLKVIAQTGDTLAIGEVICEIEVAEGQSNEEKPIESADNQNVVESDENYAKGHASPAAAKILAEKGIDAKDVKGTGVGGRITKEDALNAEIKVKQEEKSAPVVENKTAGSRNERRERMSTLRRTIAKRLVSVKNETAMLTTFNEVNMKPIMDLRKKYKEQFKEKYEIGLGFMSFFTKACCIALQDFPGVNAQIDGEEVIFHDYCDISIAVSTPKGLVVPVIRNAEQLSFAGIEHEIKNLAIKARDGKLSIPEMTGGTFTITNGGIFGSMLSTPIINAPQSAILGMHNIVERPMAINGEVVILPIMYVALSYDHRIIDGKDSVGFLVRVKELLEAPERLLLGI